MKINILKHILFLFTIILASCAKTIPSNALSPENIKVLIFKDLKEVTIDGIDDITSAEKLTAKNTSILVTTNDLKINSQPIRFSSQNGILYVNNRPFRGEIEITRNEKGLLVINNLDIEIYLVGLINHEISSKWNVEAVKAQAVIARTYALHQKKKNAGNLYHLEGTVIGQVYSGSITEDEAALEAVKQTMGEVLTYNSELALAVYHSNAGGYTEASKNVWAKDYPYLRTVESPYDILSPNFEWGMSIAPIDLFNALNNTGYKTGEIEQIIPLEKTSTGRITKIRIIHKNGKLEITGEDLRKVLGYDKLKSTRFEIKPVLEDGAVKLFVFSGKGSGHGVGLSQWGAKGMAENGYTYKEILKHYYKGIEITKIY
ncbi:MAG: SpoIID/LytB domain-containing protein [Deltaproteobacteria bacterium]|nr:SpoIID/LytB domain-containing protein [Deltaproteobacteria bacterium]